MLKKKPSVKEGPLETAFRGLRSADWRHKMKAIEVLVRADPAAHPEIVKELTATLRDKRARIRTAAALALGTFGGAATGALPELEMAARDERENVRRAAAKAIAAIRSGQPVALEKDNF